MRPLDKNKYTDNISYCWDAVPQNHYKYFYKKGSILKENVKILVKMCDHAERNPFTFQNLLL